MADDSTPDPTKPLPGGPASEPAEATIARTSASAELAMTPCRGCGLFPVQMGWNAVGGIILAPVHKPGCPNDPNNKNQPDTRGGTAAQK